MTSKIDLNIALWSLAMQNVRLENWKEETKKSTSEFFARPYEAETYEEASRTIREYANERL